MAFGVLFYFYFGNILPDHLKGYSLDGGQTGQKRKERKGTDLPPLPTVEPYMWRSGVRVQTRKMYRK